jgi:glycosyltransferase involved in cell wall biosynthesis
LKVACIIPALNEAERITPVLEAVAVAPLIDEVLVVSDGSTDDTYERALRVPGVKALKLEQNVGKAGAMRQGAEHTDADVLLFVDADLQGLTPAHVDAMVSPVITDASDMCVGIFRGGRALTDLAQKIAPVISGQRAIRREMFLSVPEISRVRMGVEIALTRWARDSGVRVSTVVLDGVTHTMKEEKLGPVRGFASRLVMYADIGRVLLGASRSRERRSSRKQPRAER